MARIEPLTEPYPGREGALLRAMMPPGVEPITLFRVLARNPTMTRAMHGWGSYELSRELSVGLREREIVILRTCAACGCEYEWGVHVAFFAGRAGLTPAQITSLTAGEAGDPCWDDEGERLLIRAVDALHRDGDIGEELWSRLAARFTEPQLLDVVLLCGWYHAISFLARTLRLEPEPGAPHFADAALGALAAGVPRTAAS
ncbi:carboxymuconolactone decarboxylase family protein [Planobispora takensis]|uniref:Carboxymuconolactone decarboxylase-like domain-containing protein n=1 Tax=Planobispora takensis TaxID=1367882 RepID=A0A8J3T246_9ACTN|nr:carboxymuconolactone decarboxylase family protein [Planobispora takensis]GII03861.1 hypothetical protein Pta02_58690 [Planobispora takensis]